MYSYVTKELPALVAAHFPADMGHQGIMGHSMGGHGAISIHLKNPGVYRSVSAFAPICAPSLCPWGRKAFLGYLGDRSEEHTSELQSLMRISYAVFCLKKKNTNKKTSIKLIYITISPHY